MSAICGCKRFCSRQHFKMQLYNWYCYVHLLYRGYGITICREVRVLPKIKNTRSKGDHFLLRFTSGRFLSFHFSLEPADSSFILTCSSDLNCRKTSLFYTESKTSSGFLKFNCLSIDIPAWYPGNYTDICGFHSTQFSCNLSPLLKEEK